MNNLIRTSQTFVNNGTDLPAQGSSITSVTSGVLGVFGSLTNPSTEVGAAPTITTEPNLTLYQGNLDGSVKKGMTIKGSNIIRYKGERYTPDTRDVWVIGYNRKTATGSIQVTNDADYTYVVSLKHDKELYSERPLDFRINFHSAVAATQLNIATQIYAQAVAAKNKKTFNSDINFIIVGDGNSALAPTTTVVQGVTYTIYGGNGATNYGVEFTGADIPQFQNTQYRVRRPYFAVFADVSTGFGNTTTVSQINSMDTGIGTYDEVYNLENFDYGFEGVLNRTMWPIPVLEYKTSTAFTTSAAITPTVTVVATADIATFSASVANIIPVGQRIVIGTSLEVVEIKYFISGTVAVLTKPIVTSESTVTVKLNMQYSVINLSFTDVVETSIGVASYAPKQIRIAFPAIDTAGAYNSISAIGISLKTLFDSYCASAPGSFAPITI